MLFKHPHVFTGATGATTWRAALIRALAPRHTANRLLGRPWDIRKRAALLVRRFSKGRVVKSRIPAAGAIVGSTAVAAVLALCVLGGVAGGVAAQASGTAAPTTALTAATVAPSTTAAVTTPETAGIESPFAAASAGDVLYGGSATTSTLSSINSASTEATASPGFQPGLGLLGGVAADQIPVAAQVVSPATVVAAAAKLPIVVAAPVVTKPAPAALPAIAGTPRQMAYAVAVRAGLSAQQWSCLSSLWQQESKFLTTARNSRSGAYGIPQALPASRMASAGADWRTNPVTQIRWGLSYISTRYGTACTAWSHWKRDRWY